MVEELERLIKRPDVRSADRANMVNMLRSLRRGRQLTYQEQQNLWAYVQRYLGRLAPGS